MPLQEESSCPNNSNLSSNIPNEIKSAKNGDEQNKSVDNHSPTTSSQVFKTYVSSLIFHVFVILQNIKCLNCVKT